MLLFGFYLIFLLGFFNNILAKTEIRRTDIISAKSLKSMSEKTKDGVFEFDSELLRKLSSIEHSQRDFNLFILFNAMDKETNCQLCSDADKVFRLVSKVFGKKAKNSPFKSFFCTIDLKTNIEAFNKMGVEYVPMILHFGPDSRLPTKYDDNSPSDSVALMKFVVVQSKSQSYVESSMIFEKNRFGKILAGTILIAIAGLILSGKVSASSVLKNEYVWSFFIMGFIILMMSGFMWSKIRSPPYVGSHQSGVMYFSTSPQSQLGIESRIISLLNIVTNIIFLIIVPITYKMEDKNKRRIAAMVLSILYMLCHSSFHKAFAQKLPGYLLSYMF